jgi:hypothetical protein
LGNEGLNHKELREIYQGRRSSTGLPESESFAVQRKLDEKGCVAVRGSCQGG